MNQEQKAGLDALIAVAGTRAIAIERELGENLRDACAEKPVLAAHLAKLFLRHREPALAEMLRQLGDAHSEELQLRTKAAAFVVAQYVPARRLARHAGR
jgi:hypothetical protein